MNIFFLGTAHAVFGLATFMYRATSCLGFHFQGRYSAIDSSRSVVFLNGKSSALYVSDFVLVSVYE